MSTAQVAPFSKRLIAVVIDLVGLLVISTIVGVLTLPFIISNNDPAGAVSTLAGPIIVIRNLVWALYFATEIVFRATPGKMIMRLRIADGYGNAVSSKQLIIRYVAKVSPVLFGVLTGIISLVTGATLYFLIPVALLLSLAVIVGFFFALGASGQALYDRIASTTVIRN